MPSALRLVALLAPPLLALGLVSPATAARYVHADATRDVQVESCDYSDGVVSDDCTYTSAPDEAEGDITRTAIRHTFNDVVVRVRHRDLRESGGEFVVAVRTNERVRRLVTATYQDGFVHAEMTRPNGARSCGVTSRIDDSRNLIVVKFARSCVSSPRWIKVGVAHFGEVYHFGTTHSELRTWGDDGLSRTIGDAPVWSPRIRRA